jgi:dCMP deaminase
MIIGVAGTNGAGKTTLVAMLRERGFSELSLSDMLRVEADARGLDRNDRAVLRDIGNELRERYGPGILMERTLVTANLPTKNYVIDSIRNPAEALALKASRRANLLLGVDARTRIRYERIVARSSATGRKEQHTTYEEFLADEEREEMAEAHGQRIGATMDLADAVFMNNADMPALKDKIARVLSRIPASDARKIAWPEYFMSIAELVSWRSSCIKRRVGAVIVRDNQIMVTGYNGTPAGMLNCDEGGCARCNNPLIASGERLDECVCAHAEQNAILQAKRHEVDIVGSAIYTTTQPCNMCTEKIMGAGLSTVYFAQRYPHRATEEMLAAAGIPLIEQRSRL